MSDYKNRTCNIKNILKDNELECLIDLDNVNTESFVNISDKIDTKDVLKKKNLDFSDVMNKIGGKLVYVKVVLLDIHLEVLIQKILMILILQ